ncbi:cytochrome P450 [Nostocaceae cyanobacterium CENA357]|uniref:Cytochrome P450 n=1 Tax=Atlanticothrix silvestris CENA357 TaxID=1725252 RepID=A0A8J7L1C0_9CYAN|nr:cytochrome P450 [Atlanticothrix silvestris]MBH8552324.1 cytochrome P450 [Atlanticothrix silvestris CENA357]
MKLPDGPKTSPLLQLIQWSNDTLGYMESSTESYGDIFSARLGSNSNLTVYVSNPQAIQQILIGESKQFDNTGNQLFQPILGKYSLATLTGENHRRHRQLIMPSFHGGRLKAYGNLICDITDQVFSKLTPGKIFLARSAMQDISEQVILKAVFGVNKGERLQKLNQLIGSMLEYAKYPFASSLFFLPFLRKDLGRWSPWGYVCHLVRQIDELLYTEIQECRQNYNPESTDILTLLMSSRDENGEPMTDEELRDELLTLIVGGKDGIASAMAWSLYWVHSLPHIREKLIQELDTLGFSPDPVSIVRLPYLNAVYKEILRISPVEIQAEPRIVKSPVELLGYELPIGTILIPSIYLVHQRQDLYPEPQQFKPERFLEKQFSYYEYLPYGGGDRRCPGSAFAEFTMKLALATVLSHYQLKLANNKPVRPILSGLNLVPGDGVKMVFLGTRASNNSAKSSLIAEST